MRQRLHRLLLACPYVNQEEYAEEGFDTLLYNLVIAKSNSETAKAQDQFLKVLFSFFKKILKNPNFLDY